MGRGLLSRYGHPGRSGHNGPALGDRGDGPTSAGLSSPLGPPRFAALGARAEGAILVGCGRFGRAGRAGRRRNAGPGACCPLRPRRRAQARCAGIAAARRGIATGRTRHQGSPLGIVRRHCPAARARGNAESPVPRGFATAPGRAAPSSAPRPARAGRRRGVALRVRAAPCEQWRRGWRRGCNGRAVFAAVGPNSSQRTPGHRRSRALAGSVPWRAARQ